MAIKHNDLEIPIDNPFLNCKLDRAKYARVLTSIIESYPEGFVLAINNKWGTGKTTFVKMWEQLLVNTGFKTIYFNAWENDFEDNPLTAFVGELQVINKKADDKFNRLVKNAALISKNVIPAVFKSFLKRYFDSGTFVEGMSETSKSLLEIFEDDVKEYSKRKESISDFKKCLTEYVANESNGKPLVFIIDELDRCRPNYAVLLLEQVKHFFGVPNIVFVLSIDKAQLGNAVCGVYGSERIDANEYLRRFIDIEYSIPDPEKERFVDHLLEYYDFDNFFKLTERSNRSEFQYDKVNFVKTSKILLSGLTLRQQEKILASTRIALRTFVRTNYLLPTVFVFLAYVKNLNSNFYNNLTNKNLSVNEVQEEFYQVVRSFITEDTKRAFVQIEAYLLKFYDKYKFENGRGTEFVQENTSRNGYVLKFESKIDNDLLLTFLTSDHLAYNLSDLKISYFLDKLDFLEDIKVN